MKRVLIAFLFFFFFLSYQNPKILLAQDSGCYQTVGTINVHITKYSPNITGNTCDSSTGGGAGTADGSGSFQVNNGRLRWVKSNGSGVEDYVFAQPTDNSIFNWSDREKYGYVIPGFNSGKPILIRDHYAPGNHSGQSYLDLFLPCGSEFDSFPDGNYSVQKVDLSKPTGNSGSCLITSTTNSLTIGNPLVSAFETILKWFFGLFQKTDYTISVRPLSEVNADMIDYGDLNKPTDFQNKHSFAGSRSTDSKSQTCFKGNVIKSVILGTKNDSNISQICNDSTSCSIKALNEDTGSTSPDCVIVTIKNIAHYFSQTGKQFYCSDNNQLINTEPNVIDTIQKAFPTPIPDNQIKCYQGIYDDLYLTPKEASSEDKNTQKMMQIPIPAANQNPNVDSNTLKDNLNKTFSPEGTSWGLNGLRPESEKTSSQL